MQRKAIVTMGSAMRDIFIECASHSVVPEQISCGPCIAIEEGKKITIDTLSYEVGGGALNTAIAFERLGFEAYPVVKIGLDAEGNDLIAKLQREGVKTNYVIRDSTHPTGTSFIIPSPSGNRAVLVSRGASSMLTQTDIPYDAIKKSAGLYIASLNGQASSLLPNIASFAHTHHIPFLINPGTSQLAAQCNTLIKALEYNPMLILNAHEAHLLMTALEKEEAIKERKSSEKQISPLSLEVIYPKDRGSIPSLINQPLSLESHYWLKDFFRIMQSYGVTICVVTNGKEGVYATDGSKNYFHAALSASVVSTIGAGDAFGSAFFAYLLKTKSIAQALRAGSFNSAAVLKSVGATTSALKEEEIDSLLKTI